MIVHRATALASVATFLEYVALLCGIVGMIGGLVLALVRNSDGDHPYVLLGIGVAIGGPVSGLVNWAIARSIGVLGQYIAYQTAKSRDRV